MFTTRLLGSALLVMTAASFPAAAQLHPNLERGFAADKAYQIGEIDHVNLYNGNVTLTIPLGGSSTISEQLSFRLVAAYNSKLWDRMYVPAQRLHPNRLANAGFGWVVSLGLLVGPNETDVNTAGGWRYQGSDGAVHDFGAHLHPGDPVTAGVYYTSDGTYLRLRANGPNYFVEFPSGIVQEFEPWNDAGMGRFRLHATRDPHGNYYSIDYTVANEWTIKDQYDRHTVVKFAPTPVPSGRSYDFQNLVTAIDSITIPGFEGAVAKYQFTYQAANIRRGYCGQGTEPAQDDKYVAVPLLKTIALYHGAALVGKYEAEYDLSLQEPAVGVAAESCKAGTITSLKVPTQATLRWTYGKYTVPGDCRHELMSDTSLGIYSRTLDAPAAGQFASDEDGTWTYAPALTPEAEGSFQCGTDTFTGPPAGEMTNTVTSPTGDQTINYFSVWPVGRFTGPSGETANEFGLPLSRRGAAATATRFISSRVCKGLCSAAANWRRTTYVAYEPDGSSRPRLKASRVVHDQDGDDKYVDTEQFNFDGVGHYRTTVTTGDFGSGSVSRSTTTNYNVRDPLVSSSTSALNTGTYAGGTSGFTLPPPTQPWILDTYSSVVSWQGSASSKQYACFDPLTGDLRAVRVLAGTTLGSTDTLAVFDRSTDPDGNGSSPGFVTGESYYGGDATPLQSTTKTQLCDFVNAADSTDRPRPLAYRTSHTYRYGSRETSTPHRSDGTAMTFKTLDLGIDISGLAHTVRDTGGVAVTYDYDPSGRLTQISPAGAAAITYAYTPATSTARAKVAVSQASLTGAVNREIHFDSLGRAVVEQKTMEDSVLRKRTTRYNATGWKTSVSEWDSVFATVFSNFDPFGKPGTIVGPDGSTTTVSYSGARAASRTRSYQSPTGVQTTSVTEVYDPLGRLTEVSEHAGSTSATSPVGTVVATKYGYDLADRLISVDISPLSGTVQPRRFSYDGRGFLKSETHPELDSEITYSYDARGHAVSKSLTTASDFDLRFVYDGAERLTSVSSRGGESFRVAKSFDFATTGVNNGRLLSANRYNYLPGSSEYYLVKEGYGYDAHGRVSSRTTNIKRVNGGTETLVREFTQSRTYNDLDLPETIVYPQCVGCGSANRTVTPGYTRGLLTSIPGFITDIDYAASGMTTAVLHANNITDVVTASANGLGRPAAVAFQGFCTAPQVTTNPADQDVERGSTVMLISGASGSSPQYQWSKRLASSAVWSNIPGANGATLSISVGAETYFHLTAVNGCGTAVSRDVRVTVFDRPTISVPPSSQTINGGNSAQLSVTASGTAPLTYRWYRGSSGDTGQPIAAPAGTQATYAPVLWATTSYWVRVMDGFGRTVDSTTATVTVVLPAPNGLTATSMTNGSISVTWNASSGAAQYRVERRSGSGFVSVAIVQSPAVTYVHSNSPSNKAYVYRVVAEDPDGGSDSAPSNQDLVTSTVFTTVQVNSVVSIGPFNEILVAINAVRSAASSSATPLTWANLVSAPLPAGGTIAEVSAITALRTQLNLARGSLGFPNLSFTDSAPTLIKAVHLNQLQDGLR